MILREVWKFCEESVKEIVNLGEYFARCVTAARPHAEAN